MRTFRYVLSWYYWVLALFNSAVAVMLMPRLIMKNRPDTQHALGLFVISIAMGIFIVVAAFLFGMAWWFLFRDRPSVGKKWVVAASLTNLFVSLGLPLLFLSRWGVSGFWDGEKVFGVPAAFGIAGLFAFSSAENRRKDNEAEHDGGPDQ
jgi:hypothetical protein